MSFWQIPGLESCNRRVLVCDFRRLDYKDQRKLRWAISLISGTFRTRRDFGGCCDRHSEFEPGRKLVYVGPQVDLRLVKAREAVLSGTTEHPNSATLHR